MTRLGELQRKVMEVLWSDVETDFSARSVEERLPGYAYTTLLTVLDRLYRKGLVRRTKDGRAFRYSALGSREDYTAELMQEALNTVTDRGAVLMRFAQTVAPDEAAVLREALAGGDGDVAKRDQSRR
jgi:predicted transcriptional regulator